MKSAALFLIPLAASAAEPVLTFERDVRPIVKAHCTHCHGEEEKPEGGVDLRLRRFMDQKLDGGSQVVVAGHPEQSELVRNDDFWGPRPDWESAVIKYLPNAASRTAALLSGTVDMIDTPSPNDLPRLQSDPRFGAWLAQAFAPRIGGGG